MRTCCICKEKIVSGVPGTYCSKIECKLKFQQEYQEKIKNQIDSKEKKYQKSKEQLVDSWLKKNTISHSKIRTVEIPNITQRCNPILPQRILAFKTHLEYLLSSMGELDSEEKFKPQLNTKKKEFLAKTVAAMCSMCRGRCCMKGGDNHAFIQRSTLQRITSNTNANTDNIEVTNVVETYLSHVPKISMDASCIYHTNTGCNLPKNLRADICSDYYCNSAHQFISSTQEHNRQAYDLVVTRDEEHVTGMRAVANDGSFSQIK